MAKLYFNQLTPTGVSATSEASGYPAANAALQSVDRAFRSANQSFPAPYNALSYDLGAVKKISCLFAHDVNGDAKAELWLDTVGGTNVGYYDMPIRADRYQRRRGISAMGAFGRWPLYAHSYNTSGSPIAELTFTCTNQGALPNEYTYWAIRAPSGPTYTIASGDELRYDAWIDPSNPADGVGNEGAGGMEINLTTTPFAARLASCVDGGGRSLTKTPAGTRGTWISRVISLTPIASKVISTIDLVCENIAAGTYIGKYRNIRITDSGGGTEKLVIWKGGALQLNQDDYSLNYYGQTIATQGSPTDGLNYWRVGSLYAMQDVVDIIAPQYGLEIETVFPQVSSELPNGVTALATTGQRYDKIRGKFMVANNGSGGMTIANLLTGLRSGVCILDLELADAPHRMWPLKMIRASDRESLTYPSHTEIDFEAVEVV